MTELLEKAMNEAKKLPPAKQDWLALYVIELMNLEAFIEATQEQNIADIIEDELEWDRQFAISGDILEKLAQKALDDHAQGKTIPLDKD